jgi:hypothetical protein
MSIPFPSASCKVLQQAHGVVRHAILGRAGAAGATIALAAGEFFLNGTETARVEQTGFRPGYFELHLASGTLHKRRRSICFPLAHTLIFLCPGCSNKC